MNNKYKYDAFISYRHTELDKCIAAELQQMLEKYRPPRGVAPQGFKGFRVFRDETELPTSSNLSDDIKNALESSRFLIVICSRSTAKSRWCMEEITYFKELHNGNNANIITLVVDGEPSEVFPEELCSELIEVTDSHGNVSYQSHVIEPLAANVASDSKRGALKKLKTEFLRIAAPMLGCGYDRLYNREQRRKTRKFAAVGIAVACALFFFGLYSSIMMLKIDEQRKEAEAQRKIAEENLLIAKENERQALIENSENLATLSEVLWKNGGGVEAIETALSALPSVENDRPVVASAERVLAEEIGAFTQNNFLPTLRLTHKESVLEVGFAGDGSTIVTRDDAGIYLWDSSTGALKKEYLNGGSLQELFFEDSGLIERSYLTKYAAGVLSTNDDGFLGYVKATDDEVPVFGTDLFIFSYGSAKRIDGASGEIIWEISEADESFTFLSSYPTMLEDAIAYERNSYSTGNKIELYDKSSGELIKTYKVDASCEERLSYGEWVSFSDSKCYYVSGMFDTELLVCDIEDGVIRNARTLYKYNADSSGYTWSSWLYFKEYDNDLVCLVQHTDSVLSGPLEILVYDRETASLKWQYDFRIGFAGFYKVGKIYAENAKNYCDILYVISGNKIVLLDYNTGEYLYEYELSGDVITSYQSLDGFIYAITEKGTEIAIAVRRLTADTFSSKDYLGKYVTHEFMGLPDKCGYYNNMYAVSTHNSNEVYVYADAKNDDFKEIFRNADDSSNSDLIFNNAETHALLVAYSGDDEFKEEVYVYDISSDKLTLLAKTEKYIDSSGFLGDKKVYIACDQTFDVYDITTGEKVSTRDITGDFIKNASVGQFAMYNESGKVYFTDGSTGLEWNPQDAGEDGYITAYKAFDSGKVAAWVRYYRDSDYYRLEVFDINTGKTTVFDSDVLSEVSNVQLFSMISEKLLAVYTDDGDIHIFDMTSADCVKSITDADIPLCVSVIGIGREDCFAVLCSDSKLYIIDIYSGKAVKSLDINSDSIRGASSGSIGYEYVAARNMLIISADFTYFIDVESFKIRYTVEYYRDYNSALNLIAVNEYNVAGLVPMYTTEQLVSKASACIGK